MEENKNEIFGLESKGGEFFSMASEEMIKELKRDPVFKIALECPPNPEYYKQRLKSYKQVFK